MAVYNSSLQLKYRQYVTVPIKRGDEEKVIRKDWLPRFEKEGWIASGPASDADPGKPKKSEGLTNSLLGNKSDDAPPAEDGGGDDAVPVEVPDVQKKVRVRKKRVKKQEA